MPLQYFYPSGDFYTDPTLVSRLLPTPFTASGQYYTLIDEGTATPNDSDFITIGINNGAAAYATQFDISNLAISADLVTLNIRYSGGTNTGGGSVVLITSEASGTLGIYSDLQMPLSSINTKSYNLTNLSTTNWSLPVELTLQNNGFGQSGRLVVYATELIFSGQYRKTNTANLFCLGHSGISNLNSFIPQTSKYYYPVQDDYNLSSLTVTPKASGLVYTTINKHPGSGTINDSSYLLFNQSGQYYNTVFNLSGMPTEPYSVQLNVRYSGNSIINRLNIDFSSNTFLFGDDQLLTDDDDYLISEGSGILPDTYILSNSGNIVFANQSFDITRHFDWNYFSQSGCFVAALYDDAPLADSEILAISAVELQVDYYGPNPCYMFISGGTWESKSGTLYTCGQDLNSGNVNMYINCGGLPTNSCNLFVCNGFFETLPLFINSYGSTSYGSNELFVKNIFQNLSGNTNLFVNNHTDESGLMNLFIGSPASGNYTTGFNMFINSYGTGMSGLTNLYIKTPLEQQSYAISGSPLFTFNSAVMSGTFPLFIPGPSSGGISNNINLFLKGNELQYVASGRPLFLANNFGYSSGSMNLVLSSIRATGNVSLFIKNAQTGGMSGEIPVYLCQKSDVTLSSGNMPIYLNVGHQAIAPLFISGTTNDLRTLTTDLFIYSTTNSGILKTTSLFIGADLYQTNANLFIQNNGVYSAAGSGNSSVNLFLGQQYPYNTIPLILANNARTIGSGNKLFIAGLGLNDGYYFKTGTIPLFLARSIDSVDNNTNLYMSAGYALNSGVSMMISGGTYITNSANLAMPSTEDIPSGNVTLHVLGF